MNVSSFGLDLDPITLVVNLDSEVRLKRFKYFSPNR